MKVVTDNMANPVELPNSKEKASGGELAGFVLARAASCFGWMNKLYPRPITLYYVLLIIRRSYIAQIQSSQSQRLNVLICITDISTYVGLLLLSHL